MFAWIKRSLAEYSATYSFVIERINTNKNIVNLLVQLGLKDGLVRFEGLDVSLAPALLQYTDRLQQSWEMTKADLLRLKRMTDETGVRLVIAVIPALPSVTRPAFEHSIAYTIYETKDFDLDKPYRQLTSFLQQNNIESVDMLDRFRAIESKEAGLALYLERDMHFNARGQKVFARGIADQITASR